MNKKRAVLPHPTDPSLALVQLTRGMFATISVVDANLVGRHNWFAAKGGDGLWYARRFERVPVRRDVHLHRVIGEAAGLKLSGLVDHENGNGLDCRRSNLRDANSEGNTRNSRTRRDSGTGVKGVFPSAHGKFTARLRHQGKHVHLGTFATIDEAAAIVREARERLHGEFANHGDVH